MVTGSRLKQSNATSESPVVEITAAQIEHTQAQTLEDALTKLPEIGTSGLYSTTNNGGGGVSCIDLRNLGIERTLVLVDGKRFVDGNANCVDLNNIPLDQVERIEILKDGASTTYGADAIAGVVNIILKKNFSGVVFHANGQIGTEAGDDKNGNLSVLAGTNFDKGNFTLGLDYLNQGPVLQADRPWGHNPVQSDNPLGSGKQTTGSFYNPNGQIYADEDNPNGNTVGNVEGILINKNGTLGAQYTGANSQRFDFGPLQQLADSLEKESITSTASYDFNDHVSGYMEAFFTHKKTGEQLAPQPINGALPGNGLPDAYVIPDGNPYLTNLLGAGSGPVDLYKRETQFGDRQYTQVDNTFQINAGFKGNIAYGWDYEVFFQYGEDDDQTTNTNNINFVHLENEAGFQQTTATQAQQNAIIATTGGFDPLTFGVYNPNVCVASAGCVLSNPFGQNLSAQAIKYATYTESQQSRFTLKTFGGSLTNNELFQLPAGPLGVSFGVEHRTESGEFTPDSVDLTGEGLGSTAKPTKGAFDVTELYGETRIPILKDLPFVKDLHIDVGGRFFDYNTFGSGETWKVAGNYTPITGIRFRGSDGVAFRQPSINDLYTGQLISFNGATDPCYNYGSYGSQAGTVYANCVKSGVSNPNPGKIPSAQYFQQQGSQVQAIVGGNPALQPETARTQTAGIVLNPPFVPRLALTADFSRTRINNSIAVLPQQFILDDCYTQSGALFAPGASSGPCSLVNQRAGSGQLSTITQINENLGVTRQEAIDFGATYSYPLPLGTVSFQTDLTLTLKYQAQNVPNGPYIGYLNTIGVQSASQPAYPRYRDNTTIDYKIGAFDFTYTMRFIEGTTFDNYPGPLVQGKGGTQVASAATPDVYYHDINLEYTYRNFDFNIGVENLFDKQPPYVWDTATNTDAAVYDVYGRVVYLKTTLKF